MAEKNIAKPKSHLCQLRRLRVRRSDRNSKSGGSAEGTALAKMSDHCRRMRCASSASCFMYSSTRVRVAGLASPDRYTGRRSRITSRGPVRSTITYDVKLNGKTHKVTVAPV